VGGEKGGGGGFYRFAHLVRCLVGQTYIKKSHFEHFAHNRVVWTWVSGDTSKQARSNLPPGAFSHLSSYKILYTASTAALIKVKLWHFLAVQEQSGAWRRTERRRRMAWRWEGDPRIATRIRPISCRSGPHLIFTISDRRDGLDIHWSTVDVSQFGYPHIQHSSKLREFCRDERAVIQPTSVPYTEQVLKVTLFRVFRGC
jgi:hypothetical protein